MRKIIILLLTYALITLPAPAKAEEQGAWAAVDSNGTVIGVDVCTESVCGSNGEWQGKVPYCDTCTYVYQLPADVNGNVAGYSNIQYEQATNTFNAPDSRIINGEKVPYPACNTLGDNPDKTKCVYDKEITYKDETKANVSEVTTYGKYKTMNAVTKKIVVKKQKKKKKATKLTKKKGTNWLLQNKLKKDYLN